MQLLLDCMTQGVIAQAISICSDSTRSKPIDGSKHKYTVYRAKIDTKFVRLLLNKIRHLI
ncbi:MAG: hypothetical protein ACJAUZ_002669 [Flavobacteriaceae bacterium]|jgi:hypothetical protein